MHKFLILTDSQRKNVYESISYKVNLPAQVIEKDFWVTAVLQVVFSLPIAEHLVFKGGTSLSKGWKLIERFSEDIDLAVNPVYLGAEEGDLTKKQIKKLRKASSLFVIEQLAPMISDRIAELGLQQYITLDVQPNGEGDNTYPEPRQMYIHYKTVFQETLSYLRPDIVLEVSARSLLEPVDAIEVNSMLADYLPFEPLSKVDVFTAVPAKTFLEKAFLLHEMFSVPGHGMKAERKSRHLYDLYMMMHEDFAKAAVKDNQLWESIRHHREIYTSVRDVDYSPEVRHRMQLVPREDIIDVWRSDYEAMKESMIYGKKPTFEDIIRGMSELQEWFRTVKV